MLKAAGRRSDRTIRNNQFVDGPQTALRSARQQGLLLTVDMHSPLGPLAVLARLLVRSCASGSRPQRKNWGNSGGNGPAIAKLLQLSAADRKLADVDEFHV